MCLDFLILSVPQLNFTHTTGYTQTTDKIRFLF